MKRIIFVALLLTVLVVPSFGAIDAYLVIKGQGWTGPSELKLVEVTNPVVTPAEKTSGRLTPGHRKWAPFVITKTVDSASPKLMQWCASGKHNVTIQVMERGSAGKSNPYYTITLTNATISKVSVEHGSHGAAGGKEGFDIEKFSLTFQKIEWTWVKGGVTASDDWEARV